MTLAENSGLEDFKPYSSNRIPASGMSLKDADKPFVQVGLFDE